MSAAHSDYLVDVARAAEEAGHGKKGPIYAAACQHLHISHAELHRRLNTISVRKPRKQRAEAGTSALTCNEAFLISGYLNEHIRRNGKRIKSCEQAVEELRANGVITAKRVVKGTGELKDLSVSAVLRALSAYGLHPGQVNQPDPVQALASPHPNWCWQIDASVCVIFKMPVRGRRIEELRGQDAYKNKLQHLAKIEHLLVQRYLITDHASGCILPYFAMGGESAEGLVAAMIHAFVERTGQPMHGAPNILMLDQASANRSAMVRNLCRALGIELSYTMPGNPRSKGQVEGAHNIFERGFESGLKLAPDISTLPQLQALADKWAAWFNGERQHSRHGMTRFEAWQLITGIQLRRVDLDAQQLRILARSEPKHPKVTPYLSVEFAGNEYDVSQVPHVLVGQKLPVCRCGFDSAQAMVWRVGEDGRETFHMIPQVTRSGPFGFRDGAAVIGREFKRHADTDAQQAKKAMELHATGAETLADAAKARKANGATLAPAGWRNVNPYKQADDYQPPSWLPKKGEAVDTPKPTVVPVTLGLVDLVAGVAAFMGRGWKAEYTPRIRGWFPDGAAEGEIPALAARLAAGEEPAARPKLAVVGGSHG